MSLASLTSTHQVSMEREVAGQGPAMGLTKKWVPVGDLKDCRIVPRQVPREGFRFITQGYEFTHTLYFLTDPGADARMRFVDAAGNQYYFKAAKNPDRLNRFFKVYVDLLTQRPQVD